MKRIAKYTYIVYDAEGWGYFGGLTRYQARKMLKELKTGYGDVDGPFRIVRYVRGT